MPDGTENKNVETRVLVFMPTGRDASLVCRMLEKAGIASLSCANARDLEEEILSGAGAVLIAEEALQTATFEHFIESLERQPVWSDVPVMLFASSAHNSEKLIEQVGARFNATIVERPIRVAMLVSAVRGALRAREKQYQTRDLLNQLEESDRQKDLFLATLSHELRTPLNSMLGWIRLLRREDLQSEIDRNHALDVIERNAKAQAELISDILFVSRVITGKLTLRLVPVDLISVIETAIDVVRPSAEAKDIRLNTSFNSSENQIEADADRLRQVFLNLLSNAIKFTPDGGQVEVDVRDDETGVRIEVKDSGQGIKAEFLPFVFERFRQADSSYTRQVGGLGLGLAIVQHLVGLHGGEVAVKSLGENQGAAFIVTLPVIASEQASPEQLKGQTAPKSEEEELLGGIRLLLVEDNKDSREMLRILFEQYGINVDSSASAAEALESIERNKPDILISDVGLPGEDGYELIKKIRKLSPEQGGNTPAIALTGYASLHDRALALEAGYQEHLPKPVDIEKLLELVKALISGGKLEKHAKL
jgi:signal transduction histidine kinase/ActR/RegA family two-component response regulator